MIVSGLRFPFAMALCVQCEECAYPDPCLFPHLARPAMDPYGVDIEKTVTPLGFKVAFDSEGKLIPAWYSMALLD
jgi:predicted metal-binding protein